MKYTIDIPEDQVERLERKRIIGMNIDNRRREMKLSQQKLAIKVGTSQFMIAKWCQGRYMPGIIYLIPHLPPPHMGQKLYPRWIFIITIIA